MIDDNRADHELAVALFEDGTKTDEPELLVADLKHGSDARQKRTAAADRGESEQVDVPPVLGEGWMETIKSAMASGQAIELDLDGDVRLIVKKKSQGSRAPILSLEKFDPAKSGNERFSQLGQVVLKPDVDMEIAYCVLVSLADMYVDKSMNMDSSELMAAKQNLMKSFSAHGPRLEGNADLAAEMAAINETQIDDDYDEEGDPDFVSDKFEEGAEEEEGECDEPINPDGPESYGMRGKRPVSSAVFSDSLRDFS